MAKSDLRAWAVKGAEQRLVEIAEEARWIFSAFPELRVPGRGFDVGDDAGGWVERKRRDNPGGPGDPGEPGGTCRTRRARP